MGSKVVEPPFETGRGAWEMARRELVGTDARESWNMTRWVLLRHVERGDGDRVALRHVGVDDRVSELTYAELLERSARFANLLRDLGLQRGDRVFSLLGRTPELWIAALGTIAAGGVYCPLFASFGPEPIRARLLAGGARFLVTSSSLYVDKVVPIVSQVAGLEHVLFVGSGVDLPEASVAGVHAHSLEVGLAAASEEVRIAETAAEDPALLFFTSGTTGEPKGAVHVQEALVAQYATARTVLDLEAGDVFWCTADPGWVTGTVYGVVAPLRVGVTVLVDEAEFDALRWLRLLRDQQVNVWYTAPTAIRRLMRVRPETVLAHRPDHLRLAASVGEPLGPEAVRWGGEMLGRPFHDTWWQTETGAIMIANLPGEPPQPGSMGWAVPGVEARVVRRDEERLEEVPEGSVGELALRTPWPSMFRGYLGDEERYRARFADGWYLSGDLVRRDGAGRYRFVARADDAIQSSGHLIGPVEVEQALRAHPAVAEAAAIGKPDPVAGERVKVFVTLRSGIEGDDELRIRLLAHARERLGPAVAPRELAFRDTLPTTTSGKIIRRQLRDEEVASGTILKDIG